MSLSQSKVSPAILAAILFVPASFCSAADPNAVLSNRVTEELTRLDSALPAVAAAGIPKEFGEPLSDQKEALDRARAGASPLLRLYRLRSPFIEIETFAFVVGHPEGGKDIAGVEALLSAQKSSAPRHPTARSLLLGALSEGAANRAEKLSVASVPFARVSSPLSGLYYLAQADAHRKFAAFADSLPDSAESVPPAENLRAALEGMETEALALFEKDPGGKSAIPVSARLKEARELLARGSLRGATLLLLETRLELSVRGSRSAPRAAAQHDDTMRALWSAMAAEEKDTERAGAIRGDVLPLHDSLWKSK